MSRRASVLIFGLLASLAAMQGVAACSDNPSDTTADAGADVHAADTGVVNTKCSGEIPVMAALDPEAGVEVPPDWSCYLSDDAGFLLLDGGLPLLDGALDDVETSVEDTGTDAEIDAGVDAADAATADTGTDAGNAGDAGQPDAAPQPSTLHIVDFVRGTDVAGASVDFFYSLSTAGKIDLNGTTDSQGNVTFTPPPSAPPVFAYRVNPRTDPKPTDSLETIYQYDNVIPKPPGVVGGNSITVGEVATMLSGVLGSQAAAPNTAILVAGARDCKARELHGAIITLIDGDTGLPVPTGKAAGQMRGSYLLNNFPSETCTFTDSAQAIWAAVNVTPNMPGNTHPYRIRMSGRKSASDAQPVNMGEKPIEIWPNASVIVRPYRLTPP
jgi:hypothetical protein